MYFGNRFKKSEISKAFAMIQYNSRRNVSGRYYNKGNLSKNIYKKISIFILSIFFS